MATTKRANGVSHPALRRAPGGSAGALILILPLTMVAWGCYTEIDGPPGDDVGGSDDSSGDDRPEPPDGEEPEEEGEEEVAEETPPVVEEPGDCLRSDWGSVGSLLNPEAGVEATADGEVRYVWGMADTTVSVELDLWDGFGAFSGGKAATGQYTIDGPEASIETCGVCLMMIGDMQNDANQRRVYLAQEGTVTVLAIASEMRAEASGVVFRELDDAGAVKQGGCAATVDQVTLQAAF